MDTDTKGLISRLTNFIQAPFTEDMGAGSWVLFVIFVISIAFLWSRVLEHIEPIELT